MVYKISIKTSKGKRKLLKGSTPLGEKTVTFKTKKAAKNFIETLTPNTIKTYQPRIRKRK